MIFEMQVVNTLVVNIYDEILKMAKIMSEN